jgi:hypothetical protein
MKGFYIFKILYKEKYLFMTETISRTNANAQTVFWFIVNMQIKKIGSVIYIIAQSLLSLHVKVFILISNRQIIHT